MDFNLPEEVELVRRTTREFAQKEVAPLVPKMDETGEFPKELIPRMGELGLLGLLAPPEYGGSGLGYLCRTVTIEEISRVSPALGIALQVHDMEVAMLDQYGSEEQKSKYIPPLCRGDYLGVVAVTEPTGGSDLMGMRTTATREGNSYVLDGRKCFITNSHLGKAPAIVAKTSEGPRGLSVFLVDEGTPGYSPGREEQKSGLRGANTGELVLKDCRVPVGNLLGEEGAGMKSALNIISEVGRPGMAAIALGILQACLDESVKFAKARLLYGRPIAQLQAIQWNLADIYTDLEAARLLCYRASCLKDEGKSSAIEMTLAKAYATEAAARASKKAVEVHGGCGVMMEYPVQRLHRDAQVCISAGGTTEIAKMVMARAVLTD